MRPPRAPRRIGRVSSPQCADVTTVEHGKPFRGAPLPSMTSSLQTASPERRGTRGPEPRQTLLKTSCCDIIGSAPTWGSVWLRSRRLLRSRLACRRGCDDGRRLESRSIGTASMSAVQAVAIRRSRSSCSRSSRRIGHPGSGSSTRVYGVPMTKVVGSPFPLEWWHTCRQLVNGCSPPWSDVTRPSE